jgi:hypothetical protein
MDRKRFSPAQVYREIATKELTKTIMNIKYLLAFTFICVTFFGCKTEVKTVEANQTNVSSADSNNTNSNVETAETIPADKVFSSLATPRDTFKSHYAALAVNNEELLRKTLSQGIISFHENFFVGKKIVETMRGMLKRQGETTDMPAIISETTVGDHSIIRWKGNNGIIVEQPLGKAKDGWKMEMGK